MTSAPHVPELADSIHSQVSMVTERSVNMPSVSPPPTAELLASAGSEEESGGVAGLMRTKGTEGDLCLYRMNKKVQLDFFFLMKVHFYT